MKSLRKISLVITMIILLVCIFISNSYATIRCNVSLSMQSSEAIKGEEISVYANISNISGTKGIIAMGAVIEYDKNALTLLSITGENGWSNPSYNESNGKIATTRNDYGTENETVIKMTFKVNETSANSAWVKVNNFQVSDGDGEINLGGSSKTITIKDKTTTNPDPITPSEPDPVTPSDPDPVTPTKPTTPGNNNQGSGTTNKPSGNKKPSTSNNNNSNNTTNTVDEAETNTNVENETIETNTNTEPTEKRNIDALIKYPEPVNTNNSAAGSSEGKGVIYAIGVIGAIMVLIMIIAIVKSSSKEK